MRHIISGLIISVFFLVHVDAQVLSRIDFNLIGTLVTDSSSSFFYPRLMERYISNDTTLAEKEYQCLYYGYIFQEEYSPYSTPEKNKKLDELMGEKKYRKAIDVALEVHQEAPFFLNAIYSLYIACSEEGRNKEAAFYLGKYTYLITTILNSGTGQSTEDAYVVMRISDEYEIMAVLGLQMKGQALIGMCDRMELLTPNDYDLKYLFFNIEKPFSHLSKMFQE